MTSKRILCAIDFDDTIVNENSDLYIKKLLKNPLSDQAEASYDHRNWTTYMQCIFEQLHQEGTTKQQLLDCLATIETVDGMPELLAFLKSISAEIVIISDANKIFIEHILESKNLFGLIDRMITNPAQFDDDGRLVIQPYHHQEECQLSSANLCKGKVLEEHIKLNGPYEFVCYIGDGSNDYCPSLRLKESDITCARKGRSLMRLLTENPEKLTASKLFWNSGLEIIDAIKNKLENI